MAEGAGLENRYTGNGIVGSNPTLSAILPRAYRALREGLGTPPYAGDMMWTTRLAIRSFTLAP